MKFSLKLLFRSMVGLSLIAIYIQLPVQAEQTVLRMAHAGAPTSSQHLASLEMAKIVSKLTNGTLRIDIFPSSQLGNDAETMAEVKAGTLDMAMGGSGNFTSLAHRLAEIDFPFSFQTPRHAWRELDSKYFGGMILAELAPSGVKGLVFWELGFRLISSNKGFIKTPGDLDGLRLRVYPGQAEYFKSLGAKTVSMPLGELYEALKADKLDAQDHPLGITYSAKLNAVQKYITLTRHAYTALLIGINAKRFESLSAAHQKALMEGLIVGRDFQRDLNSKSEAAMLADLRNKGVQVLEEIDSRPFRVLAIAQSSKYFSKELLANSQKSNQPVAASK